MGILNSSGHVLEGEAVYVGLIGRPGCPERLEELPLRICLAFVERMYRQSEQGEKELNDLYAKALKQSPSRVVAPPVTRGEDREAELKKVMELFGG